MSLSLNEFFAHRYKLKISVSNTEGIETWLAEDTKICAEVLLKISVEKNNSVNNAFLLKEFLLLTQIRHRNLLVPLHYDESGGMSYIVYPATETNTLKHQIISGKILDERSAIQLFCQLSEAVSALHQEGIYHRNIHPGNIFLLQQNFMLGHFIRSSEIEYGKQEQLLPYTAPEIFSAHPNYTVQSDLFSIAATVYFSCTAIIPWNGLGGIALIKGAEIPYLFNTHSPGLNAILCSCLQPIPLQRPSLNSVIEKLQVLQIENNTKVEITKNSKISTPIDFEKKTEDFLTNKNITNQAIVASEPKIVSEIKQKKIPIAIKNATAENKNSSKKYVMIIFILFVISMVFTGYFLKENVSNSWANVQQKDLPVKKVELFYTEKPKTLAEKNTLKDSARIESLPLPKTTNTISYNKTKNLTPFFDENQKWGYKNKNHEITIAAKFQDVYTFSEGIAAVKSNGYWGYIKESGKWLIYPQYENATHFQYGKAKVVKDGISFVINLKGECVEGCESYKN